MRHQRSEKVEVVPHAANLVTVQRRQHQLARVLSISTVLRTARLKRQVSISWLSPYAAQRATSYRMPHATYHIPHAYHATTYLYHIPTAYLQFGLYAFCACKIRGF